MITLPMHCAVQLLACGVSVYDLVGERVNGHWRAVAQLDRRISAVVQPADERALQLLAEGDRSLGAVWVHTRARLYGYDVEQGGTCERQTIVRHGGALWRVCPAYRWRGQPITRYLAIRYVDNDPDQS